MSTCPECNGDRVVWKELREVPCPNCQGPNRESRFDGFSFHPIANCFPLIDGAEFDELVADLRANGLREPVVLYQDQILDGRNRYRACAEAGVPCRFETYDGSDPVAYAVSLNLRRRHLNEGQRAWVAAQLANMGHGRSAEEKGANLRLTHADAGRMLNVSERSVDNARVVRDHGVAELPERVAKGETAPSTAADVARLPEPAQREIVARGEREILEAAKKIRTAKVEKKRAEVLDALKELAARNEALPVGRRKYSVIYADPPWSYHFTGGAGTHSAAENHYPTMTQAEIEALPVGDLAADDCALFLWAVMPQLPEALATIKAWGFEFKTCAFVWVKQTRDGECFATGMGNWTRSNAEICLLATKGSPQRLNADVHQVVSSPRMEHSRKPDEVAERIERLVPGPYIELFARRQRDGWAAWGNQAEAAA